MRRYLVVAHRTLAGAHLLEHLRQLRDDDPSCRFHVVVPVYHPHDRAWSDGMVRAAAQERLDEMLARLAEMGMGAAGEVGDANPVNAIGDAIRADDGEFSGIVLSTLPKRRSRWWNVPTRVARQYPWLPLTHLVADEALVP